VHSIQFTAFSARRDISLDYLRGLAMACVIINHSRLSSPLSWFSYERMWVVTAAEVFVVLSGVVLGMVYGRRLAVSGWQAVVRGLGRRAALLYAAFVGVTLSVPVLASMGIDVTFVAPSSGSSPEWFLESVTSWTVWRDVLLMRSGPWPFEIIGLYVWLVAAAVPCLLILRRAGWRPLLAVSWALYLWYRIDPHTPTSAGFESAFPLLAWQLLFVHGVAIGYYRADVSAFISRLPRLVPIVAVLVTAGFTLFAMCNPATVGPSWIHLRLVSGQQFGSIYGRYFALSDLRVGRLLNLAIALPVAYAALTRCMLVSRPLGRLFVTLGQRSLGAFVLHVYGLILLANVPMAYGLWMNTLAQVLFVLTIAVLLEGGALLRRFNHAHASSQPEQLAA
jgi:hypothetical protein